MRVLSGIQPSGALHLGNYYGAMRQHIALQQDHEALYFIANYHTLTTVHDAPRLRQLTQTWPSTSDVGTSVEVACGRSVGRL